MREKGDSYWIPIYLEWAISCKRISLKLEEEKPIYCFVEEKLHFSFVWNVAGEVREK